MSLTNPKKVVTEERLSEFYGRILPYLGGSADTGFTPVGTVISVMGVTAPANYLACNGQVVNIADYPELSDYFYQQFGSKNKFGGNGTTTFGIPDLRGEFLRGTGTNSHSGNGNGASVGTHQNATRLANMLCANGSFLYVRKSSYNENTAAQYMDSEISGTTHENTFNAASNSANSFNPVKFTLRPTNTSVLYCIATKNIYLNPSLDYSTTEKIVGTWIDGKTIYQKTFTGTTPTFTDAANNWYEFAIIDNMDNFINIHGRIYDTVFPVTFWSNNIAYFCRVLEDSLYHGHFAIQCNRSTFSNKSFNVTIQYTKTTD